MTTARDRALGALVDLLNDTGESRAWHGHVTRTVLLALTVG